MVIFSFAVVAYSLPLRGDKSSPGRSGHHLSAKPCNEVKSSLAELVPLFDLVIAHTPRLAEAYGVQLGVPTDQEDQSDDGVVVSLHRHLETQKMILAVDAA